MTEIPDGKGDGASIKRWAHDGNARYVRQIDGPCETGGRTRWGCHSGGPECQARRLYRLRATASCPGPIRRMIILEAAVGQLSQNIQCFGRAQTRHQPLGLHAAVPFSPRSQLLNGQCAVTVVQSGSSPTRARRTFDRKATPFLSEARSPGISICRNEHVRMSAPDVDYRR